MKVDINKVTVEMQPVKVTTKVGEVNVFPVQYRDYHDGLVHVQSRASKENREYGFAYTYKGHVAMANPQIPSLAGTGALYHYGVLVVGDTTLTLVTEVGNVIELEVINENSDFSDDSNDDDDSF